MAHRYYELTLKVLGSWNEKYKAEICLEAMRYSLYQAIQKAGLPFMIETIKEKEEKPDLGYPASEEEYIARQ